MGGGVVEESEYGIDVGRKESASGSSKEEKPNRTDTIKNLYDFCFACPAAAAAALSLLGGRILLVVLSMDVTVEVCMMGLEKAGTLR